MRDEEPADIRECAYDAGTHLDGAGAVQDIRGHQGAVLSKGVWEEARVPVRTGRKLRTVQGVNLVLREAEHEVSGEASSVTRHLFVQAFRLDSIELREVGVEHNPLAPEEKDPLLEAPHGNCGSDHSLKVAHFARGRQSDEGLAERQRRRSENKESLALHSKVCITYFDARDPTTVPNGIRHSLPRSCREPVLLDHTTLAR